MARSLKKLAAHFQIFCRLGGRQVFAGLFGLTMKALAD
jgi:hypothetical protein